MSMRRRPLSLAILALVAIFVLPAPAPATEPPPVPVMLDPGIDSLRTLFNAHADEVRFVTILSPT